MAFFEPPPPPSEPPPVRHRLPDWMGPPEHLVPGVAALELLLVSTGSAAVWVGSADVYPHGVLLDLSLHGHEPARAGVESGSGTWRFGVQFSDGRKATVFGLGLAFRGHGGTSVAAAAAQHPETLVPEGPLLQPRSGGGSRTLWRQEYWLWPLPPAGELLLACEWPNAGIDFSTATISADPLRAAAERARELWPAPDVEDWPGPGE